MKTKTREVRKKSSKKKKKRTYSELKKKIWALADSTCIFGNKLTYLQAERLQKDHPSGTIITKTASQRISN